MFGILSKCCCDVGGLRGVKCSDSSLARLIINSQINPSPAAGETYIAEDGRCYSLADGAVPGSPLVVAESQFGPGNGGCTECEACVTASNFEPTQINLGTFVSERPEDGSVDFASGDCRTAASGFSFRYSVTSQYNYTSVLEEEFTFPVPSTTRTTANKSIALVADYFELDGLFTPNAVAEWTYNDQNESVNSLTGTTAWQYAGKRTAVQLIRAGGSLCDIYNYRPSAFSTLDDPDVNTRPSGAGPNIGGSASFGPSLPNQADEFPSGFYVPIIGNGTVSGVLPGGDTVSTTRSGSGSASFTFQRDRFTHTANWTATLDSTRVGLSPQTLNETYTASVSVIVEISPDPACLP
ncbi:MAG: hypothetical protein AAFQ71_15650 [Planctomycetota bacterium]